MTDNNKYISMPDNNKINADQLYENMNNSSTKRKRSYKTTMRCEECSVSEGRDVYLYNDVNNGIPILCHLVYHNSKHNKKYKHG